MNNPLLTNFDTPYSSVPFDIIKPEHLKPAFENIFSQTRELIDRIINNADKPDFSNTLVELERSVYKLNLVSNVLFNLNVAETNPEIQDITRDVSPMLSDFSNDIILNEKLFARIKYVYDTTDRTLLSKEDERLLEKTFDDFVRHGANLNKEDKEKYRKITNELARLTVDFGENVLAETNDYFLHLTDSANLSGIPEDIIVQAKEEAESRKLEGWVFTLQFPSYVPFLKYSDNRDLRKQIFLAYNKRGLNNNKNNNCEIVWKIAGLRLQMANILGFSTYADFVLANHMAKSPEKVYSFLNDLLTASMPFAQKEYKEVQALAEKLGANYTIESWDFSYFSEKLKKERFNIDDEMTRPYFKLENVEKGVFDLASTLYGLTFKQNGSIPVYHCDVKVFEVFDKDGSFLALLYMDYFPREGKKGGAWMTEFLQQHKTDEGTDVRPHVSLVFNFTKPTKLKPSLLTYGEVTTILHEFGHALHGMLSKCNYQELAGTNVYRDFVELPSQIMENWAEQKEWLDRVAIHFQTGEKIPADLVQKIIDSRNFNTGFASTRQLSFALTDLKWHTLTEVIKGDLIPFEQEAMSTTQVLPFVEGTAFSPSFSHIFSGGYAAGYYSYKWAEVLDADAFSVFKETGIFNSETAFRFRKEILSKGGTEHPMTLYVRFRGQEPSIEPLLERSGLKAR